MKDEPYISDEEKEAIFDLVRKRTMEPRLRHLFVLGDWPIEDEEVDENLFSEEVKRR